MQCAKLQTPLKFFANDIPGRARHVETYRDGMADGRELERESIIAFIQELQENGDSWRHEGIQ